MWKISSIFSLKSVQFLFTSLFLDLKFASHLIFVFLQINLIFCRYPARVSYVVNEQLIRSQEILRSTNERTEKIEDIQNQADQADSV